MNPSRILFALALLLAAIGRAGGQAPATPATAEVGGQSLVLNGKATRTVWGFPVYHVGLFLEERNPDGVAIMTADRGAKRIHMNMLRAVEKKDFMATVRENVDQNLTAAEKETYAAELAAYLGHLEKGGDIQPGRIITIDYVPGQGTVLGLDGRQVGTIAGHDFYHVMLRLWIGRPLQASIKEGLLGGG